MIKKTTQEFIEESNKIHHNKYDYSLVDLILYIKINMIIH